MKPKSIVHLLSGGLDSVTMLYDLKAQGCNVRCLLFDYKQQHVQELTFAKWHCHQLGVLHSTIELPELGGLTAENWIVPNRNAIMLSIAVNLAVRFEAEAVSFACNHDDADYFPDCRLEFIQSMNESISKAGYDIEILTPYLYKAKSDIVKLAGELNVDLNQIWTCYRGGEKPCGICPACVKLENARDEHVLRQ